ncbi:hypothetical protein GDO81_021569 [Engystomops pustulosus]|uniref:Secreted protein n=1 Tax=Engystomops pustulosus TaxID=76066 RepID=A0AAV6Z5W7_ENGPU|nr:hypothetical protein GDO81_026480 [Engystomops pustulosus]KAG8544959.1 hypothetical protein GDO81_021569 [Engystomops pustulosus]
MQLFCIVETHCLTMASQRVSVVVWLVKHAWFLLRTSNTLTSCQTLLNLKLAMDIRRRSTRSYGQLVDQPTQPSTLRVDYS